MKRLSFPFLALSSCAAASLSGVAFAAAPPVPNNSFEQPVLSSDGGFDSGAPAGWSAMGRVITTNPRGASPFQFIDAADNSSTEGVPTGGSGKQSVELDGVSSIESASAVTTVQAQKSYSLSVAIGDARTIEPGNIRVGFLIDGAFVTTPGFQSYVDLDASNYSPEGTFKDFTFNYIPRESDLNKPIKIYLGQLDGTVNTRAVFFDNVRLFSADISGALISEFRLGGPSAERDEFLEIYNKTAAPLDLTGWTISSNGASMGTIPTDKVIPIRGRLLLTGSNYSLSDQGGTGAAAGDASLSGDLTSTGTIELRNAAGTAIDTVTPSNLTPPTSATSNYSYVRRLDSGFPLDTDVDANDFNTVDVASTTGPNNTTGISSNLLRLGAPGPQNLSSALTQNGIIGFGPASSNAMVRTGSGNSGTLALRQTITNRGSRTITSLRFHFVGITGGTTSPVNAPPADIRPISSSATGNGAGGSTPVPLTLLEPSNGSGGGLNSSVSLSSLPGGGLAPGQEVTLEFLFNIFQKGTYRYLINFEPVTTATP